MMRAARAIAAAFRRLYDRRVSPLPLAAFRIAFSLVCLVEVSQIHFFRVFLFDPVPGVVPAPWFVEPAIVAWMIALVCVAVGWRTRIAAAVNWAMAVAVLGFWAFPVYEWHLDSGFITGSLLMLLTPVGAALSVDSLIARGRDAAARREHATVSVSAIHAAFLALAVGLMYWDSALWKTTSPIYLNGLGFWAPASLPYNTFMDVTPLLGPEPVVRAVGYLVLLFEVSFLALVWLRRARGPLVAAGITFHLGILAAFPIPLFSLQMISFYLGIVPAAAYERIARRLRRREPATTVYFDGDCPLCRRTAAIFGALDVVGGAHWLPFRKHAMHEPALAGRTAEQLASHMHAVGPGGRVHAGAAAYSRILRSMRWPAPLGWLLAAPPVSTVARLVYGLVAERRARAGACDDTSCASETTPARAATAGSAGRAWLPARAAAAAFLIFWLVSAAVIALASPFHRTYVPLSAETHARLERTGNAWRELVYPWTGFAAHGVFMDYHFENYTTQLMIVQRGDGVERELPLTLADGTSGAYGWGRGWAHWIFRTASPDIPDARRDVGLRRWVAFWMSQGGDTLDGEIVIRERPVEVSLYEWRPNLGRRNRETPWHDVARITGEPGDLRIEWLEPAMTARSR